MRLYSEKVWVYQSDQPASGLLAKAVGKLARATHMQRRPYRRVSRWKHPGPMHSVPWDGSPRPMAVSSEGGALTGRRSRGLTSRARTTSQLGGYLTGGLSAASQCAGGVALDGGAHQGAEGCAFGYRPGLGGVPDVVFDPGCPLWCGHTGSLRSGFDEYPILVRLATYSGMAGRFARRASAPRRVA